MKELCAREIEIRRDAEEEREREREGVCVGVSREVEERRGR